MQAVTSIADKLSSTIYWAKQYFYFSLNIIVMTLLATKCSRISFDLVILATKSPDENAENKNTYIPFLLKDLRQFYDWISLSRSATTHKIT